MLRRSDNWILTGAAILARDKVVAAGALLPELGSFADGFLVRKIALMSGFCYIPEPVATWQVFETSVSRQTASDPAKARTMLSTAVAQFTADRCFPRWYSALFSRRWRFAVCRLAANATPINEAVLLEMGVRNRLDRVTISALCRYLPSGATPAPACLALAAIAAILSVAAAFKSLVAADRARAGCGLTARLTASVGAA